MLLQIVIKFPDFKFPPGNNNAEDIDIFLNYQMQSIKCSMEFISERLIKEKIYALFP